MKEVVHVMIPEEDVNKKICEMAEQMNRDYAGKDLHLICILKGSVFFCCELAKTATHVIRVTCGIPLIIK